MVSFGGLRCVFASPARCSRGPALRELLAERTNPCKAEQAQTANAVTQLGNVCRESFSRRSVVLVFAGFRTWRLVRARSAARVEERGRRELLHAMRLELNGRR